ncbi:MAG: TlpA family protein disulfide reductase [Bacteroidales bacterium]|nr:TlpA family protein disulfide reductase [Bacteroidales bacterium]
MKYLKYILLLLLVVLLKNTNAQNLGTTRGVVYSKQEKCALGQQAPNLILLDQNQNEISLNSFQGKYLLIQFWASWCKPCRIDNGLLKNIYIDYKTKKFVEGEGFEILSISLDNNDNQWRKAIKDDNISQWYQVSELMGVNSDAVKTYNVNAIPANFLIDGNRKIIAKQFKISELPEILDDLLYNQYEN